jgi:hypothetical protein
MQNAGCGCTSLAISGSTAINASAERFPLAPTPRIPCHRIVDVFRTDVAKALKFSRKMLLSIPMPMVCNSAASRLQGGGAGRISVLYVSDAARVRTRRTRRSCHPIFGGMWNRCETTEVLDLPCRCV